MAFTGWPSTVSTTNVDAASDSPAEARDDIYTTFLALNQVIEGRAQANGIASLGATGVVPDAQLNKAAASGTCGLDASAYVSIAQDPYQKINVYSSGAQSITAAVRGSLIVFNDSSDQTFTLPATGTTTIGTRFRFFNKMQDKVGTIARNGGSEYIAGVYGKQLNLYLLPGGYAELVYLGSSTWQIADYRQSWSGSATIDGSSVTSYSMPALWTASRAGTGLIDINFPFTLGSLVTTPYQKYLRRTVSGNTYLADVYSISSTYYQIRLTSDGSAAVNGTAIFQCEFDQGFFQSLG